jgi:serine/threonine protein kinase
VASLRGFTADLPATSAVCTDGTWRTTHSAKFCVTNSTSNATVGTDMALLNDDIVYMTPFSLRLRVSEAPEATSSKSHAALMYGVIVCGCVLMFLVAVFVWQRFIRPRSDSERLSSSKEGELFDSLTMGDTFNFDDTNEHVDPKFLEDPVVVTNRIEYKQLKVGKCISRGGFGLVFAGEYHGRRVAIKKIRPDRVGDVSEIETFFKEIILIAQLYHPRIVEFVGVAWDVLRHLSAVTELMDHGDLRNVLYGMKQQGQPLTWEGHKTGIALQIAEALEYLHSLKPKVIHRDLKSKNVLLNLRLEAKLSDFGISKQRSRMETHLTAGIGTSFWIAPEVLLGKVYDERADIYSYGVVLSEIDTDDFPYWNDANAAAASGEQARGKIQEADILGLVGEGTIRPSFSDSCPRSILELADCCLQRDPRDRPSATEIVVMLQHILHASERSSSPSPTETAWVVPHEG